MSEWAGTPLVWCSFWAHDTLVVPVYKCERYEGFLEVSAHTAIEDNKTTIQAALWPCSWSSRRHDKRVKSFSDVYTTLLHRHE